MTSYILFDDNQLGVYSMDIGDLLVRCSIEIEAIAKDLYIQLGGNENLVENDGITKRDLYFDTDCMKLLVDKWKINKKKIIIHSSNMYFLDEKLVLTPLHKAHKRETSGSK